MASFWYRLQTRLPFILLTQHKLALLSSFTTLPASTSFSVSQKYSLMFFAVLAGNISQTTGNTPGSYSVWQLNMTIPFSPPSVSLITSIPEAGLLNGISPAPEKNIFLISDSVLGLVWRLNVVTGAYSIAVSDPLMILPKNSTAPQWSPRLQLNPLLCQLRNRYLRSDWNHTKRLLGRFSSSDYHIRSPIWGVVR